MQHAFDVNVFALFAVCNIAVAMIVVHRQAEDQRIAAGIFFRQFAAAQKGFGGVGRVFEREAAAFRNRDGGQLAVAGGDQVMGIGVDRAHAGTNLS